MSTYNVYSSRSSTYLFLRVLLVFSILASGVTSEAAEGCVPAPAGAIAWWPLDETAGPVALEIAGVSPGIYFGTPSPAPGIVDGALRFDGSNSFVGVADKELWAFGHKDFTIELWANFTTPGGGTISHPSHILIGSDEGPGNRSKWFLALGGGFLSFHTNSIEQGPRFFPLAPFSPRVGEWYHLALSRADSLYRIFINGEQVAAELDDGAVPDAGALLTLGQAENLGFMKGLLDEVTIYERALTEHEIGEIASTHSAGKCKRVFSGKLSVISVSPDRGGNSGTATVTINGSGFSPGASVELVDDLSVVLAGANLIVDKGKIRARFDLRDQPPRRLHLRVTNPDGSSTLATDAFSIIEGGGGQLSLRLLAPGTVRAGRNTTFYVLLLNEGVNDVRLASVNVGFNWADLPSQVEAPVLRSPVVVVPTGDVPIVVPAEVTMPADLQGCGSIHATSDQDKDPTELDCEQLTLEITRILLEIDRVLAVIGYVSGIVDENGCEWRDPPPGNLGLCEEHLEWLERLWQDLEDLNVYLGRLLREWELRCEIDHQESVGSTMDGRSQTQISQSLRVCAVNSWDPNEKRGPAGHQSYLPALVTIPFLVDFENQASATAPAQTVWIADQLSTNLDWSTVSFGSIRLGSRVVHLPPNQQHVNTTVDLRPEQNLIVSIEADVNRATGVVSWRFASIDPKTAEEPTDPLAGFLPPNVSAPEGEGSVSFTVAAREGLLSGTRISNRAEIIFDLNEPIVTNTWTNTIDTSAPTSSVLPLGSEQSSETFKVDWSGEDEGSGVRDYQIFVSRDGGPFVLWLADLPETSASFVGEDGSQYEFYSIARDWVGNLEEKEALAEAGTSVQLVQDRDGDGVADDEDRCPDTVSFPTVVIDGCDSRVPDHMGGDGCSISDEISNAAIGSRNHGEFVRQVVSITNRLRDQGAITGRQAGEIKSCAAAARIP